MIWLHIAVWLAIFWAGLASGQVYRWTDRQGNVHFTDNPSRIPPEYRATAEVERVSPSAPSQAPSGDTATAPPTDTTVPSAPRSEAPPTDRLGRGRGYWQQLAQQWSARLQQHTAERDRLQQTYNSTRNLATYTRDGFDRRRLLAEIAQLEQAMAAVEAQINEAEIMLRTTLPLEARRLGADPDWLMPPAATQQ
jgi:hypothetical protein